MESYIVIAAAGCLAVYGTLAVSLARSMMANATRSLQDAQDAYARATALYQEAIDLVDDRQLELELIGGKMNDR